MASKLKLTYAHIMGGVILKSIKVHRLLDAMPNRSNWPFVLVDISKRFYAEIMIRGTNATFLVKKSDIKKVF